MRGFLAVAQREISEKRFVFLAAVIASLIPFLAPLAPGIRSYPADEARDLTAFFFAGCFAVVLSFLLGATMIARDLAERRLGFYFSKPLSGLSIAGGKTLGSTTLAFAATLLVLLPVTIAGGGVRRVQEVQIPLLNLGEISVLKLTLGSVGLSALLCLVILTLILFGHCCGVILRSHSRWLALDAVGLAATVFLFLAAAAQLSFFQIPWRGPRWSAVLGVGLLLVSLPALLAANIVQSSSGRTDLQRSHRALSITLWGCLILIAASLLGGSVWYVNPLPRDLVAFLSVTPAPEGNWIALSGVAKHRRSYFPGFLYNVVTGSFRRLRSPFSWEANGLPVSFSRNGKVVAWLDEHYTGKESSFEIVMAQLDGEVSREQRIRFQDRPRFFLSPDGGRLAVVTGNLLSVIELPSTRSIFSVRLPADSDDAWPVETFVSSEEIYLVRRRYTGEITPPWSVVSMFRADIPSKKILQTGEIRVVSGDPLVALSSTGDRLIIEERTSQRLTICDAISGVTLGSITGPPLSKIEFSLHSGRGIRLLADGRILMAEIAKGQTRLQVLSPDGEPEKSIGLGKANELFLGGQPSERTVLVALSGEGKEAGTIGWRLASVDLTDGELHTVEKDLLFPLEVSPLGVFPVFPARSNSQVSAWRPGSLASKLFVDWKNGSLVEFNPSTGERRVILGGSQKH